MDSKAWYILTEEERSALMLSINHNKSSWQAGEIIGKAHYKYLEIQARARHFFKIFTEYYNLTSDLLIPEKSDLPWDFQIFINSIIGDRNGYRHTLKIIGRESDMTHKKASKRTEVLVSHMENLRNHKDPTHRQLHDLILEFDRWNNFRVLPDILQEPSAFKRRNKTRLLKHLKNLNNLDAFLIDRLYNKFKANKGYRLKILYLPIISDSMPEGYNVIKVKATSKVVEYISKVLNLYMFLEKKEADKYGLLVEQYLNKPNKDCKQGQVFWPKFRTIIKKADNYNQVNNIIPRRDNLEIAFRDLDKINLEKKANKKPKDISDAQERVKQDKIWNL